jgi:hypothetical protein
MNAPQESNKEVTPSQHHERDAVSLRFMSYCFIGFAGLLSLGLFYDQTTADRVVNVASATLLALIGGVCLFLSCKLSKKSKQADR